jgi:hypothetical protein
MSAETYSLAADFGGAINEQVLKQQIEADAGIAPTTLDVGRTDDVVTISFSAALSAGEKTTLDGLVAAHDGTVADQTAEIFDAIVDVHGNGDYLLPSQAFAAGHVSVFVRNGTYVETTNVVVPNYGNLTGESAGNVVIYFAGLANGVVVDATGGTKETAGTISATTGSTTITGVGTTFTNLTPGTDYILVGTNYYKIASVTDNTTLDLENTYVGSSISGYTYTAQTMYTGVRISTLIIAGSTTHALYCRGNRHMSLDSIALQQSASGIYVEDSGDSSLYRILAMSTAATGVTLHNCVSISSSVIDTYNNAANGIAVSGNSRVIALSQCEPSSNGGAGISVGASTENIIIELSMVVYNTGTGIDVASGAVGCVVTSTTLRNNGAGSVIGADSTTFSNNQVVNNAGVGIAASADDCCVTANIVTGNTDGIRVTGSGVVVNSNVCGANSLDGVHIVAGATDTICTYNNLRGNTGSGLVDNGTTSETTGNKT